MKGKLIQGSLNNHALALVAGAILTIFGIHPATRMPVACFSISPGGMNIDINAPDFVAREAKFDRKQTMLVNGHAGSGEAIASAALARLGLKTVCKSDGGLDAWEKSGNPGGASEIRLAARPGNTIPSHRAEAEVNRGGHSCGPVAAGIVSRISSAHRIHSSSPRARRGC
jgi:hypothetical protein